MNNNSIRGISVIVCCYNSANRIRKTLSALVKQQCNSQTLWEIILVDNASTDHTSEIALSIWEELNSGIKMQVVSEPRPGLGHARRRGSQEACYSYLLFCDDDNWLAENYVQGVLDILESDANIAACGGMGVPIFETDEPFWFYKYAEAYALGSQEINSENGQILNLYGAGLAVKRYIFEELYELGFDSLLQDRTGKKLSSAGDTELTYAFVLMGYKLHCTDELKFFHYLPKERLTLEYLKRLFIAFGSDGPIRNLYYAHISNRFFHKHIKSWGVHFILSIYRLIKYLIIPPKKYGRIIYLNWNIAYIKRLLSIIKTYSAIKSNISRIKGFKNQWPLQNISLRKIIPFEAESSA